MPDAFTFELVSPERLVLSAAVEAVQLPAADGEMTVMAHHAPVMTTLRPGVITASGAGAPPRRVFVRGGFADVGPDGLTVLAERAVPVEDIDRAMLDNEVRDAEAAVADAAEGAARDRAAEKLQQLKDAVAAV